MPSTFGLGYVVLTLEGAEALMAPEPEGFREYVLSRERGLMRAAWLLTGDWGSAEDLVQTALAKAWPRWHALSSDNPDAYVRRILVNTYATWWRRRWRAEIPTASPPERTSQADDHQAVEDRDLLRHLLHQLPKRQRTVLVLRYFEDLSEKETAEAMGCSVGSVKSQASRGLAQLRLHTPDLDKPVPKGH